jgi:hypothetical protein
MREAASEELSEVSSKAAIAWHSLRLRPESFDAGSTGDSGCSGGMFACGLQAGLANFNQTSLSRRAGFE